MKDQLYANGHLCTRTNPPNLGMQSISLIKSGTTLLQHHPSHLDITQCLRSNMLTGLGLFCAAPLATRWWKVKRSERKVHHHSTLLLIFLRKNFVVMCCAVTRAINTYLVTPGEDRAVGPLLNPHISPHVMPLCMFVLCSFPITVW